MEKIKFESEIPKYTFRELPKNYIEREVILQFVKELPIETLKKLFNLKEIDFEDKNLKEKSIIDNGLYNKLDRLRYENKVLFECEIEN